MVIDAIIGIIFLPLVFIVEGKSKDSGCIIGFVTGAMSSSICRLSPLFGKRKCKGGGGCHAFGVNAVIKSHIQSLALFAGRKRSRSPIVGPWTLFTGAESTEFNWLHVFVVVAGARCIFGPLSSFVIGTRKLARCVHVGGVFLRSRELFCL